MKKIVLSIAAIVTVLALTICLAGCGTSPEDKLKDYVGSSEFQEQLSGIKSNVSSVMDVDVTTDDSSLIMNFTLKETYDNSVLDIMKSSLESSFTSIKSTFTSIASAIHDSTGIEDPKVVIVINNGDGSEIIKETYSAE